VNVVAARERVELRALLYYNSTEQLRNVLPAFFYIYTQVVVDVTKGLQISIKKTMKSAFGAVALLCAVATLPGADAGAIKLCVTLAEQPVAGASIACFDKDLFRNDFLVNGTTATDGCATLTYQTKTSSFWSCWSGWDACYAGANPDIFCRVSAPCIAPKKTVTKNNQNQNVLADFGTVAVVADAAFCGDVKWNGCGPSDFPPWLIDVTNSVSGFESACNSHDACYAVCSKSRAQCDNDFKASMYAQCNGNSACRTVADGFYGAVRARGERGCIELRSKCTSAEKESCKT
jgi:hypothetical protein